MVTDDETRRSALWGLAALGIIAVLVIAVLLFTSGGGHHHGGAAGSTAPVTVPISTLPASSSSPAPHPTTSTSPGTSPVPASTANPCPGAAQCAVPGDAGQVAAAVNAFRATHGQKAVPGAVSAKAQQCALAQGDGPSCAPSYSWEPAPTQDGPRVVSLVAGRGGGTQWLLDPGMTSFSVGWAYASGQWECAILKNG